MIKQVQIILSPSPNKSKRLSLDNSYVSYPGAEKAKLEEEVKANLRKHHFVLGEDKAQWDTNR